MARYVLLLPFLCCLSFNHPTLSIVEEPLPKIAYNDNREAAGGLSNGVLDLELEVRAGRWHVLGDDQPGAEMLAFAEAGGVPQIPGPMIRVPVGTVIRVSITNPLEVDLVVHGLSARRVTALDSLVVKAGTTVRKRLMADAEGTYYYWGSTTGVSLDERSFEDSQLSGAFIVDGDEGPAGDDRVMVLGLWTDGADENGDPDLGREFLVINGRPWPLTERLRYAMGDSVRWRLINATAAVHPMHLHGFYFRVDARGDLARDTIYWPAQRRMAVTERLLSGTTMTMVWSPDRPGGWIFHCHITWHVIPNPQLGPNVETSEERDRHLLLADNHHDPQNHVVEGMGGLMMGIYVEPPEGWESNEAKRRQLRLFVQSDSTAEGRRQFGYVLQRGDVEPVPDSVELPGSPLILWKGEPTSVWVLNRTDEPTQVHWHGLEIESYFDGVAGVGGYPQRLTPAILPGDSFEMRITPQRAGSFMYHTHVNDVRQQSGGLYGAFIVLEEGADWNPDTDRILLIGNSPGRWGLMLNGSFEPPPQDLRVGIRYRLRLMNITLGGGNLRVRLVEDGQPVRWRALAKDGFDLPEWQRTWQSADKTVAVGEIFDFEYRPEAEGDLRLEVLDGEGVLIIQQAVRVIATDIIE